jgi:methylglyoxal synthase
MKKAYVINRKSTKYGKIAFITTPQYRKSRSASINSFVYRYMYSLCYSFDVITTGRTYDHIIKLLERSTYKELKNTPELELINLDYRKKISSEKELDSWRKAVLSGLYPVESGIKGMIDITYQLVEGRVDAVIHFTDWQDKSAKPDSAVLSREANVYNVPIATNVETAEVYVKKWNSTLATMANNSNIFTERKQPEFPPLEGINKKHRVLAMIAHDNMKLEMCRFAVEHAKFIFDNYDYILATGTTGNWIRRFMEAIGRGPDDLKKIRCCNSGPYGGDIQIAYAVVKGLCHKIIFLQDPSVNHPHDSDIRLFEQAVVTEGLNAKLAVNVESAQLLIYTE